MRSVVAHNRNIVDGSADDCQRWFNVCIMNIERILSLLAEWFLLWFSYYSVTLRKFFILRIWIDTILISYFADEKLSIKLKIWLFRSAKCLHEMT